MITHRLQESKVVADHASNRFMLEEIGIILQRSTNGACFFDQREKQVELRRTVVDLKRAHAETRKFDGFPSRVLKAEHDLKERRMT